jgi:hypothetical protein
MLRARATAIGPWEGFDIIEAGGYYVIRSLANGLYVSQSSDTREPTMGCCGRARQRSVRGRGSASHEHSRRIALCRRAGWGLAHAGPHRLSVSTRVWRESLVQRSPSSERCSGVTTITRLCRRRQRNRCRQRQRSLDRRRMDGRRERFPCAARRLCGGVSRRGAEEKRRTHVNDPASRRSSR